MCACVDVDVDAKYKSFPKSKLFVGSCLQCGQATVVCTVVYLSSYMYMYMYDDFIPCGADVLV